MGCVRKRRGKWVVDYTDGGGRRRWLTCESKDDATKALARKLGETGVISTNITLGNYGDQWVARLKGLKPNTLDSYKRMLGIIKEWMGGIKLENITRPVIKRFFLSSTLGKGTLSHVLAILRLILGEAVEDGLLLNNPSLNLGKRLRLKKEEKDEGKAFTREELGRVLGFAREWYPLFLLLARTGMRIGEALALEVGDVNFEKGTIRISKNWDYRHFEVLSPKNGKEREVDMSLQLSSTLKAMLAGRREEYFRKGQPLPTILFPNGNGEHLLLPLPQKGLKAALQKAGLDDHFTLHSFRHTFASILLQDGISPVYVQTMLGHSSISLTVDRYGKHLPKGNRENVNRLDEMVANL